MNARIGLLISALGLVFGASACGSDGSAAAPKKNITRTAVKDSAFKPADLEATIGKLVKAIDDTAAEELQLGVVLKELAGYWEPIQIGASRAIGELGATGGTSAPDASSGQEAIDKENAILQGYIDGGYDGFGVAPFEAGNRPPIDAAADAGMHVVTIDSDLADSKRDLYVGTINAEAGKTAGNTLKSLLTTSPGTVILLGHDDPGWVDGYARTMAAKDVLEAAGYTVGVLKTNWDENGEATDLDALATMIASADPPVVGMMGMFSNAFRCAMAAEAAGLTSDQVAIAAFDFDAKTVEYMRSGMIKATHAQRQYYMGYMVPYVLYGMKVLGVDKTKSILKPQMVDDARFNAGLDVINATQLDEYYSFLDSLGVGGS
jgi:ribose transport system substrate-binding protein